LLSIVIAGIVMVSFMFYYPDTDQQPDKTDWREYPYIIPGTDLHFPDVEGSPEDPGEEKWISLGLNIEFTEKDKDPLYIVLLYHPDFKSTYIFGYQEPIYEENIRGEMDLAGDEMDMRFVHQDIEEDDVIKIIDGEAFSYELEIRLPYKEGDSSPDIITLSLTLDSTKPPATMYNGTVSLNHLYYNLFALTNCEIGGEIVIGNDTEKVEGVGWLEHQWGRFDTGMDWDWFSFWAEGDIELEIVDIHSASGNQSYIMYVDPDGEVKTIDETSINVTSTYQGYGRTWVVTSSKHDIYLEISIIDNMMVYGPGYIAGFGGIEGNIFGYDVDTLTYIESTIHDPFIPIP